MTFVELPGAVPSRGAVTPSVPPVTPRLVRFTGNGRAYFRLLVRGSFLLALTLGIYRFWLSTDIRRFFWINTEVNNDTLEYTGTPSELLIGFLIAIAILVPIYVGLFVLALNLGEVGQFMGVFALPLLAFLGQFAVYRARRYRLTRTVFRGIQFHQGGSALRYAVCAMFWWTLVALTLGLAYPFAQASLERFKMRNTYYGNLRGRFEGSGGRLFVRGIWMWLAVMAPLVLAIAFPIAAIDWSSVKAISVTPDKLEESLAQFVKANPAVIRAFAASAMSINLTWVLGMVLYPVFQAVVLRWWIDGLRIGDVVLSSKLQVGTIFYSYVRFIGWSMLFGLIAIIVAIIGVVVGVAVAKTSGPNPAFEIVGVVAGVGFYVIIMLGYSVIYQSTVKLTLWRHAIDTLQIANLAALDDVKAEGVPSSALGEGLADALNVGGI